MKLLDPIQIYEGDGINPRWVGYLNGDGRLLVPDPCGPGNGYGNDHARCLEIVREDGDGGLGYKNAMTIQENTIHSWDITPGVQD